jgi:hypothetical protein
MSVDAYPAGPYGLETLEIIDSFSFMGFRDGGDPFTELHLNDYYDPDGAKNIKAVFMAGLGGYPSARRPRRSVRWCSARTTTRWRGAISNATAR